MLSPPISIFNSLHSFPQFTHETVTKYSLPFYLFYLNVYPPDSQESNKGANAYGKQLPQPASENAKILLSA